MSLQLEKTLRFRDRAWLRGNVRAIWMLGLGARGMAGSGIAVLLFVVSIDDSGTFGLWRSVIAIVLASVIVAAFLAQGAGSWRLGSIPASGRAPTMRARAWVRWAGLTLIAIPGVLVGNVLLNPVGDAGRFAVALMSFCAVVSGFSYLFALCSTLEGLHRRTSDWNPQVSAWYAKYRRNLKILVAIGVALVLYAVIARNSGQVTVTGVLAMLAVVIELISLETAMGRVAEATRLELAVAEERAREGS
jgi:hypothetical protein